MRKFLPRHVLDTCREDATRSAVPFHDVDEDGVAAVIDISGFTDLSCTLLKLHGADGAAKLRDAINRPLDKIIRNVYGRAGSIVKFAGDAAIACWSKTGARLRSSTSHELRVLQSFLCCLELLESFRSGRQGSSDGLNIHIGIGIGRLCHVHVGRSEAAEAGDSGRREYFIAGEAISDAGDLLSLGDRGDFVMANQYYQSLSSILTRLALLTTLQSVSSPLAGTNGSAFLIQQYSPGLTKLMGNLANLAQEDSAEAEAPINVELAYQYIESSVALFIAESFGHVSFEEEHYSDTRVVTAVFFRFPNVRIVPSADSTAECGDASTAMLYNVQRISMAVIECVCAEGGSVRQLNIDDKGFTALAVWGLRGLAHQRGEASYALTVCIKLYQLFEREIATNTDFYFQAGVASGLVYAGLIGNDIRADGTVLGSPVNLAARLMCLENSFSERLPNGCLPVFCDDPTFLAAVEDFEFGSDLPMITPKGFPEEVKVHYLVKARGKLLEAGKKIEALQSTRKQTLYGREDELARLSQVVHEWRRQTPNQHIFLTGRSGLGKSSLSAFLCEELTQQPNTILCQCTGDEIKQKVSFGVLESLFRAVASRLMDAGLKAASFQQACTGGLQHHSRTGSGEQRRRKSVSSSLQTSQSNIIALSDPTLQYLVDILVAMKAPRATFALIAAVPGLKSFTAQERVSSGDVSMRLSIVISQIFEATRAVGFEPCLICDDIQWFDKESLSVVNTLLKLSKQSFVALIGRTRAEWDRPEIFDEFEKSCQHRLKLEPLSEAAVRQMMAQSLGAEVPDRVIQGVFEKTNGVPVAVQIAVATLQATSTRRASGWNLSTIMDRDKAIAAQLDTLSPSFRTVVSVASVIGQYFDLETTASVLGRLSSKATHESETTAKHIEELIQAGDRFGFVFCRDSQTKSYAFRHYLLQQGVLLTLLPSRRERINRAIFSVLVDRLQAEGDNGLLLPLIIARVMTLNGSEELKSEYLYRGFIMAGEEFKAGEAFHYLELLESVNPQYVSHLGFIDVLRHFRILSLLHMESGEWLLSWKAAIQVFVAAGYLASNGKISTWKAIPRLLSHLSVVLTLNRSSDESKPALCLKFLCRFFPRVRAQYLKHWKPSRSRSRVFVNELELQNLDKVLRELSKCLEMSGTLQFAGAAETVGIDTVTASTCFLAAYVLSELGYSIDRSLGQTFWKWPHKFHCIQMAMISTGLISEKVASGFRKRSDEISDEELSSQDIFCKALFSITLTWTYYLTRTKFDVRCSCFLLESIQCFREAGVEFGAAALSLWPSLHSGLQLVGNFRPEISGGTRFSIHDFLCFYEKHSPTRIAVLALKLCLAIEAAVLCDTVVVKSLFRELGNSKFRNENKSNPHEMSKAINTLSLVRFFSMIIVLDAPEEGLSPYANDLADAVADYEKEEHGVRANSVT
ncbi:hypothetical protein DFJ73DRAFT_113469 [Zopfochytrium polystomum]|nr:hypothetical protein DFJ73DRAFT_113469 [Zopfochytrium polystomum]